MNTLDEDVRSEHSNFIFFQSRKIVKFCHTVLQKNTAAARNKSFKCAILFIFNSKCSIVAQVRQVHMGRGRPLPEASNMPVYP